MSASGATKRDLFRVIGERDAEITRLRALILTPQEAAAILNAGTYSTASVNGWKKVRSMRDAK